jgi:endonuclease/exonuclease/phosphatase family metal-dependent hydrolase
MQSTGKKGEEAAERHGREDAFSVLTFNLRFGLAKDGPNSWNKRKHALADLFANERADFIGLQEANDFQIRFVQKQLQRHQMIGQRRPAPDFWQNNVIFYGAQWRCLFARHLFLSPTPDIPSRFRASKWPRQCTIGLFEKSGHRLICLNTHFDFEPAVQKASARIIMAELHRLPADLPVVLMGDFNAPPASPCYAVLTEPDPEAGSAGNAFKLIYSKPYPGTFHGFTGRTDGECIDWILYRGTIKPESYRVIRSHTQGAYPSDHFPVRSEFRFTQT